MNTTYETFFTKITRGCLEKAKETYTGFLFEWQLASFDFDPIRKVNPRAIRTQIVKSPTV